VSITRRIGRQRLAELALTGATIDAPTAAAWGLVDALEPVAGDGAAPGAPDV
jgi:enoyl-CoA hydratase/carnithine racemase